MKKTYLLLIFNLVSLVPTLTSTTSDANDVIVALVNDTVTLDCDDPFEEHVLWKKSATQVVTDGDSARHIQHQNSKSFPFEVTQKKRHRRNKHSGSGKLTLSGVDATDSGVYSCHSLHRERASLKSWTLVVLVSIQ